MTADHDTAPGQAAQGEHRPRPRSGRNPDESYAVRCSCGAAVRDMDGWRNHVAEVNAVGDNQTPTGGHAPTADLVRGGGSEREVAPAPPVGPSEHLWLGDLRRHPEGEVRLIVDGRLVSGTTAGQVIESIDAARTTAPGTEASDALRAAADAMPAPTKSDYSIWDGQQVDYVGWECSPNDLTPQTWLRRIADALDPRIVRGRGQGEGGGGRG